MYQAPLSSISLKAITYLGLVKKAHRSLQSCGDCDALVSLRKEGYPHHLLRFLDSKPVNSY